MQRLLASLIGALCLVVPAPPGLANNPSLAEPPPSAPPAAFQFQVRLAPTLSASNTAGRLFVILHPQADVPEPRLVFGETGLNAPPFVARDVDHFSSGDTTVLRREHATFPLASLDLLPPGRYRVQALLSTNRDLRLPNAPGSFISSPRTLTLGPDSPKNFVLELDRQLPPEQLPPDTDSVRFLKLPSPRLTEFHGRPMFLRASVVLPRSFTTDPQRRYPLLVMIGGFGQRFTSVTNALASGGHLDQARRQAPEFILLQLDGAGPWGDPYQINSDNNGPYGDAVVRELIPHVEQRFRGEGEPHARLLTGGSTGGWVALALQLFYPDFFGGSWSGFPDSPDFHALQLVNLYADPNAYVNAAGFERPSKRELNGDIAFTMRHELQLENCLGTGNRFPNSGGQWGSWAAVYGPVAADGAPAAPWDPRTGAIDPTVVRHWENYDLNALLDRYWSQLAPRLQGKIHAWVGLNDDYFLDGGLRRLAETIRHHQPALAAELQFEPGVGHGWNPKSFPELLTEMRAYITANTPKSEAEIRAARSRAESGPGIACPRSRVRR